MENTTICRGIARKYGAYPSPDYECNPIYKWDGSWTDIYTCPRTGVRYIQHFANDGTPTFYEKCD